MGLRRMDNNRNTLILGVIQTTMVSTKRHHTDYAFEVKATKAYLILLFSRSEL